MTHRQVSIVLSSVCLCSRPTHSSRCSFSVLFWDRVHFVVLTGTEFTMETPLALNSRIGLPLPLSQTLPQMFICCNNLLHYLQSPPPCVLWTRMCRQLGLSGLLVTTLMGFPTIQAKDVCAVFSRWSVLSVHSSDPPEGKGQREHVFFLPYITKAYWTICFKIVNCNHVSHISI